MARAKGHGVREPRREPREEAITGIHAVAEALAAGERLNRVIIGKHRSGDRELSGIVAAANERRISLSYEPESAFRQFADARHQHVIAFAPPFHYADWAATRALARQVPNGLVVAIDHIEDPHNLGAILRSAEAAGVRAVVMPDRRNAGMSAAVRRAASGAASHLRLSRIPNLARALEDLKSDGYWVIGMGVSPPAQPYTKVDYRGKCVIVVGSEGRGLSRLIAQRCDAVIHIPMLGRVASLNASCAAAVVLFEAVRQRSAQGLVLKGNKRESPVNP